MYIFKYALLAIVFDMFTSSYKCVYISSEALNTTSTYILRTYVVYTKPILAQVQIALFRQ